MGIITPKWIVYWLTYIITIREMFRAQSQPLTVAAKFKVIMSFF
jgi:hypothetical protein